MAEIMKVLEQETNSKGEYISEVDDDEAKKTIRTQLITLDIQIKMPYLEITRTCVVHNNYLKAMYELKKEEYKVRYSSVREMTMFHSTSECNAMSIIKDNLDWRRVSRSKYGQGVSFSLDPDYANYHSNSTNGSSRAFIIASVLVSNIFLGHNTTKVPIGNMDTAKSSNGYVYVKFNDHEFLPKYVVFYDAPDKTKSKHFRNRRRF